MGQLINFANPEVTTLLQTLDSPKREIAEAIRQVILSTDAAIGEQVKWNAPAYFYTGEMAAFNPKEYKRDIVVFNLRQKDHVLLIFPTGATIPDTTGLLQGDYTDGRRMVKIYNLTDLQAKAPDLQTVLKLWLQTIP